MLGGNRTPALGRGRLWHLGTRVAVCVHGGTETMIQPCRGLTSLRDRGCCRSVPVNGCTGAVVLGWGEMGKVKMK